MDRAAQPESEYLPNRRSWRAWLEKNHSSRKEIWLLLYKKGTGRGMTLDEAIEEAVCFGWIDSRLRRIDDEKHVLRFSPRRPGSPWAESNLRRAEKLVREGKMTESGACLMPRREKGGKRFPVEVREGVEPEDLRVALDRNPVARRRYSELSKSNRIQYIHWIVSAKKQETRERRVTETVRRLVHEAAGRSSR